LQVTYSTWWQLIQRQDQDGLQQVDHPTGERQKERHLEDERIAGISCNLRAKKLRMLDKYTGDERKYLQDVISSQTKNACSAAISPVNFEARQPAPGNETDDEVDLKETNSASNDLIKISRDQTSLSGLLRLERLPLQESSPEEHVPIWQVKYRGPRPPTWSPCDRASGTRQSRSFGLSLEGFPSLDKPTPIHSFEAQQTWPLWALQSSRTGPLSWSPVQTGKWTSIQPFHLSC